MPLFDTYLMVDWSAAKRPKRGADSIWWAEVARRPDGPALVERSNPATRRDAETELATRLDALSRAGRRTLVGFDFPFGYPRGTAERLGRTRGHARQPSHQPSHQPPWRQMWRTLADEVEDGDDNSNSRFDLAERLNQRLSGEAFPFWGHDGRCERPLLRARGRRPHGPGDLAERRLCEHRIRTTQPVWKLAYTGAVGSQALLGIPRVQALRADRRLREAARIWPFETGLAPPDVAAGGIVLAEVYPSLVAHKPEDGLVKDACQVRTIAEHFAVLDAGDELAPLFAGDSDLSAEERRSIEQEEAWILGVTAAPDRKARKVAARARQPEKSEPAAQPPFDYLRDPQAIYAQSFATVRAEADLSAVPAALQDLAVRLVHACGMPEITADLAWGGSPAEAARRALEGSAPVLADCRMVADGVIRDRLPAENDVICTLPDTAVPALAKEMGTTRSAAAVELWLPRLEGAVVAIGNAPTALFRLLELLLDGAPRPAVILGFPVGFVGAAESKEALIETGHGVPFVTLRGRRGGSPMAAAAVNALARNGS